MNTFAGIAANAGSENDKLFLRDLFMGLFGKRRSINIDTLSGKQFEQYCAEMLKLNGYNDVKLTNNSADHGVDITARKHWKKYSFQCKRYSRNVGNKAVQEAYSGKALYRTDIAVVITSSHFTKQAISDAAKLGVQLWDRDKIKRMVLPRSIQPEPVPQPSASSNFDGCTITSFVDKAGETHFLDDRVTTSLKQMQTYDHDYYVKAKQMMIDTGKSVFYCIKLIGNDTYRQGNYFLIPIEEEEKENIIHRYADRFYIGIVHKPLK
jgi:hypothetical protein